MSTLDIVYRHLLPVNGPPPRILEDLRENVNMVCELEWSELPQTEAAKALRKPYSFSEDRRGSVRGCSGLSAWVSHRTRRSPR
jgi:hypothetical protein